MRCPRSCRPIAAAATILAGVAPGVVHARGQATAPLASTPARLRGELVVVGRYGSIDGFAQTPAGGRPGSSSAERPTFDELGVDAESTIEVRARAEYRGHMLHAGYAGLDLAGSERLASELVSRSVTIPAGTRVDGKVALDQLRAGYARRWPSPGAERQALSWIAGIGVAAVDFDYRLHPETGSDAERSYLQAAPELLGEIEWRPGSRLSVTATGSAALPIPGDLTILRAALSAECRVWSAGRTTGAAVLGIGYELIDYEDDQSLPNHVRSEYGPFLLGGLRFRF